MNVEVAVLGSSPLIVLMVSVDVKHHTYLLTYLLTVIFTELRSCVKVEVAVLVSPSLIVLWSLWT